MIRTRHQARSLALLPALLIVPFIGGCADPGRNVDEDRSPGSVARRWAEVGWDTVFIVGGSADDTLLHLPTRLAADRSGVSVLDRGAGRVLRFDPGGRLLWSVGRPGHGPEEFWQPRDIQLDGFGRSWVLDADNSRLVRIDADGRSIVRVSLTSLDRPAVAFVPWPSGEALLLTLDRDQPFIRLSSSGRVLERLAFPWPGYRALHPLASQLVVAHDVRSDRWAAAFGLGDGFFVFRGLAWQGFRGRYVESSSFPRVEEQRRLTRVGSVRQARVGPAHFTAEAISIRDGRLFVFFGGRSPDRHRLMDVYSLADGAYVETLRLPGRPRWAVHTGDLVYALYEDPYPTLAAWRPKEKRQS